MCDAGKVTRPLPVQGTPMSELQLEYALLLRQYGAVQKRCTESANAQAREIDRLRALVVRLRGELIRRDTVIAVLHDALQRRPARPMQAQGATPAGAACGFAMPA